jgi:prepilin-type N-terminal cleavage/methylation domain-containing protein
MPTAKKIRAFTLVELLIVIAAIAILSVGAYTETKIF